MLNATNIMEVATIMLLCCHIYELQFVLFWIPYYILADKFLKSYHCKTQSIKFVNELLRNA